MKQSRLITIFAYMLLIAGCMGIVFVIDKVTETGFFPFQQEERRTGFYGEGTEHSDSSPPYEDEGVSSQDGEGGKSGENGENQKDGEDGENQKDGEGNGERENPESSGRRKWYTSRRKPWIIPEEAVLEEPKGPPKLILATDMHYLSSKLTDYGEAFQKFTEKDDGKVVKYSSELMDAFLEEALEYQPDGVILSGDLTVNGEKVSHQELAKKLSYLQEAGVQVLVIPGNHDINNPNAASYIGEEKEMAESTTPEEFYQIYRTFGYDQAASRDEASLSYRYDLDDTHWLLMLDSCQYEPYNKVGGKIKAETYIWIRKQYEEARKAGAVMIPVAHHNLMGESRVYPTECAIEGGEELISIMEEYQVPLYLSGHLHLQRIKKYQPEPGTPKEARAVTEAVTASLSIAPCQYSTIEWQEDDSLVYGLKTVDVSAWARGQRSSDENLLDFDFYSQKFVKTIVEDQIYQKLDSLPEDMKRTMAAFYGELNYEYCFGMAADKEEVKSREGYRLWERLLPDSKEMALIEKMIADLNQDHLSWDSKHP